MPAFKPFGQAISARLAELSKHELTPHPSLATNSGLPTWLPSPKAPTPSTKHAPNTTAAAARSFVKNLEPWWPSSVA